MKITDSKSCKFSVNSQDLPCIIFFGQINKIFHHGRVLLMSRFQTGLNIFKAQFFLDLFVMYFVIWLILSQIIARQNCLTLILMKPEVIGNCHQYTVG